MLSLPPEIVEQFHDALERYVREKGHGVQSQLAIGYGCAEPFISSLVNREKLAKTEKTQRKVAESAGLSYKEFLNLAPRRYDQKQRPPEQTLIVEVVDGSEKLRLEEQTDHYRAIPLYESGNIGAFSGGLAFNTTEAPDSAVIVHKPELGRHGRAHHELAAARIGHKVDEEGIYGIDGRSMEPTIQAGSIVVIDLSDKEFVNNRIFIVRDPREPDSNLATLLVKRVQKLNQKKFQGFALISDNKRYHAIFTDSDWPDLVVGRVVWAWRSLEDA